MPDSLTRPNFDRHPMLWLAAAFAAGILVADLASVDLHLVLGACAISAIAALVFRGQHFAAVFILIAFAAAGAASSTVEKLSISPDRLRALYDSGAIRSGDPVEIEGVLTGRPEPSMDGVFLNLRSEKIVYNGSERKVSGNVRLFVPQTEKQDSNLRSEISDLKYGSRIRAAGSLEREDAFINPGVIPRKEIFQRLGIDAAGSVKSELLVEKIADESVFLPLAWVYDQRANLIDDFRNNLGRSAAGIMIASLLGDKYFLDKDTADLFREGGTFHILVISGLHITFIGGLLLLLMRQLTRNRWLQFIVAACGLWAYALAVGADVPVVRAAIMFTIICFSYVIYRRGSLLNSLGLCGLILLVWRPSDLFNPSFQLTFVSVAAIVAFAYPLIGTMRKIGSWTPSAQTPFPPNVPMWFRRFCETLYWSDDAWTVESKRQIWTANLFKSPFMPRRMTGGIKTVGRYLVEGVLVSLAVQLWMLPLLVIYFHRVSVVSILLNLWVGFFIALESFAAVIGAVANHFSTWLAAPFFMFAEVFNWLMLAVPRLFADNGWASFRLPAYSGPGRAIYFLYFLPLLILAIAINRWKPLDLRQRSWMMRKAVLCSTCAALVVLLTVIVLHPLSAPRGDGRLHFDFLDVGQADSALVTFPDGKTLLVDGGGSIRYRASDEGDAFEPDIRGIGEAVVSEVLWYRGYSRIDHILATHADADHMQGLTDVAKNFSVGSAIVARAPLGDADFAELADVLRRRRIPVEAIGRGDRFEIGGVTVEVLHPTATDDPFAVSDNDHSIVLRLVYGTRVFLLTGDIETAAESELVTGGGTLASDLVKVPHHGSRTSSTDDFVNAVAAKYAIISVGRSSPFGHPHREVVQRWNAFGARVVTTGERGMISVSTDGTHLDIKTFVP